MTDINSMRGNEFIKRVETLAKARGVECRVDAKRGKGSHETLYYARRKTIVRNRRMNSRPAPSMPRSTSSASTKTTCETTPCKCSPTPAASLAPPKADSL